jgi:hypothetical protein
LNTALLKIRKTAVEPVFDLIAQIIGTTANHKQLSVKGLANVPCQCHIQGPRSLL